MAIPVAATTAARVVAVAVVVVAEGERVYAARG